MKESESEFTEKHIANIRCLEKKYEKSHLEELKKESLKQSKNVLLDSVTNSKNWFWCANWSFYGKNLCKNKCDSCKEWKH